MASLARRFGVLLSLSSSLAFVVSACGSSGSNGSSPSGLPEGNAGATGAAAGNSAAGTTAAGGSSAGTSSGGAGTVGGSSTGGTTSTWGNAGTSSGGTSAGGTSSGGTSAAGTSSGGTTSTGGSGVGAFAGAPSSSCMPDPDVAPSGGACVPAGAQGYACNPVTGAPCAVDQGATCEFDGAGFQCFPKAQNLAGACYACAANTGPFCVGGFTCLGTGDVCTRYCCDDGDCASGTKCVAQPPSAVGICSATDGSKLAGFQGASGGTTGSGGSTGSAGTTGTAGTSTGGSSTGFAGHGGSFGTGGSAGSMPTYTISCDGSSPTPSMGACAASAPCNPITNTGCDTSAGEMCEVGFSGIACTLGTHATAICGACAGEGECSPGLSCTKLGSGQCGKLCCDDGDCGTGGKCELLQGSPVPIGYCVSP